MTPLQMRRVFAAWLGLLVVASLWVFVAVRLDRDGTPRGPTLISIWRGGKRVARRAVDDEAQAARALREEEGAANVLRIDERIVDSAAILPFGRLVFAASVAPAKDGVSATYRGASAYLTPDDLRSLEAYESDVRLGPVSVAVGINPDKVLGALARELHTKPDELFRHGRFRRFCVDRSADYPKRVASTDITDDVLKTAVKAAAHYLLMNQHEDGSFRYELNAVTGEDEPGYNFPRHAGATYFLARAANQLHDARLFHAAQLAGSYLKDRQTLRCGADPCIGEGSKVDVGSSALAVLAYVELASGGAPEFHDGALDLAGFLRAQQRPDGEFQHVYSIAEQHPVDVQFEYYTGEAAFALSRVNRLSNDARDLEAARRALSFLIARPALFVGAHYFWGTEHWTCQVMEDLWTRAPDPAALRFCLDWQAVNRGQQFSSPPMDPEYDGAMSRGPFLAPRLTPLASRMEAAVATLSAALQADVSDEETDALTSEIERGFAFLLRYQYMPGPTYLMADPHALFGGFPGSPTDMHVRIDYPQHAGGALLRYWELKRK